MVCNNCGRENPKGAKFCSGCGSSLENSSNFDNTEIIDNYDNEGEINYPSNSKKNGNKKKIGIIIGIILGCILLIFIIIKGINAKKAHNLRENAEVAFSNKNYEEAMEDYAKLYKLTKKEEYRKKIEKVNSINVDYKALSTIDSLMAEGSFRDAIENLNKIKSHNNELKEDAEDKYKYLIGKVQDKVEDYNAINDYSSSIVLIDRLLRVAPENEVLLDLKKNTEAKINTSKEEQKKAEEAQRAEEAQAQKNIAASTEANRILNTYQYVTSSKANVRSGPGLNYDIIYTLVKGDEVYVLDTKRDSKRTWCNIGYGWISYRTLNGEL